MVNTTPMNVEDFGAFLRHIRFRRGISQERLAKMIGCSRFHIWRLEHRERNPSRMFLRSLANLALADGPEDQHLLEGFEAAVEERERPRLL